jgi:hypothetical protein
MQNGSGYPGPFFLLKHPVKSMNAFALPNNMLTFFQHINHWSTA